MRKVKKSILEACHGALLEAADYELEKIMSNINDINTDPKKKRTMTIKISFVPNQDRKKITMSTQVLSKVEPVSPVETTLFNVMEQNNDTGERVNVLREVTDQAPGQLNVFGDITEQEVFVIGYNAEKIIEMESGKPTIGEQA